MPPAQIHTDRVRVLMNRWQKRGCEPTEPASDAMISRVEAELGVELPEAMRAFYRLTDGSGGMDSHSCLRVWPLEELRTAPRELEAYVTFADFLICSQEYAVCFAGEARGHVVEHSGPTVLGTVAPSFERFIALCLSDEYPGFTLIDGAGVRSDKAK